VSTALGGNRRRAAVAASASTTARESADVLAAGERYAGNERDQAVIQAGRRNCGDDLIVEHALLLGVNHIDDRRFALDRDRLLQRPHSQFDVDERGERAGELDPLTSDRAEPRERERDDVRTRTQVLDAVLP